MRSGGEKRGRKEGGLGLEGREGKGGRWLRSGGGGKGKEGRWLRSGGGEKGRRWLSSLERKEAGVRWLRYRGRREEDYQLLKGRK